MRNMAQHKTSNEEGRVDECSLLIQLLSLPVSLRFSPCPLFQIGKKQARRYGKIAGNGTAWKSAYT